MAVRVKFKCMTTRCACAFVPVKTNLDTDFCVGKAGRMLFQQSPVRAMA